MKSDTNRDEVSARSSFGVLAHATIDAWRSLVRHRGFAGFVIATLAIGAGSATSLVGLIDAIVRPPAHVAEPDRLVRVNGAVNYVIYNEVARRSRALDVAAVSERTLTFGRDNAGRPIKAQCVTAGYFGLLGAAPVVGRAFQADDERRGDLVTMLAYGVWQRDFGGRADAIGAVATIGGRSHRIVGIAPPDFRGLSAARVDVWLLMTAAPDLCSITGRDLLDDRKSVWLTTLGRLRAGVSLADAEREMRSLLPDQMRHVGLARARELDPAMTPDAPAGDVLLAVALAAGAVVILLIACANVAGLLSVRAFQRRREIAVRVQLGASRPRVFLQLFAENGMLSAACVMAAWGVARGLTALLSAFFPVMVRDEWLDPRSVVALCAFTVGAGVAAGIVPAVQAVRATRAGLWRVGHEVGRGVARWRAALIVSQVALSVVLVASAGLFTHSLVRVTSHLGYDLDHVLVAPLDLEQAGVREPAEIRRTFDDILQRVRTLRGVDAASLTQAAPYGSGQFITVIATPVNAPKDSRMQQSEYVSPEYFETVGTRLREGRPFGPEDRFGAPEVMIVDADLARELWPGERVVGRCKSLPPFAPCATVVGISEPRRFEALIKPQGEVFKPLAQWPSYLPQAILVRSGDLRGTAPAVAAAIRSVVPSLAFADVRPMADLVDGRARSWRVGAMLFSLFGGLAVVLAAVGLYASLAFAVRRRTAEIGVRMALGASPASVARLVLGQGVKLVAIGWCIGTVAALVVADGIRSLLFGVQPADPTTFVVASLVAVIAGLAGSALPALMAARLDPVLALRSD